MSAWSDKGGGEQMGTAMNWVSDQFNKLNRRIEIDVNRLW